MNDTKWVQHISGEGEKWEVTDFEEDQWMTVLATKKWGNRYFLPKSEYASCDPHARWVDVTDECTVETMDDIQWINHGKMPAIRVELSEYRLRKVDGRLIVEQKDPS